MNHSQSKHPRILALALSSRGFGYAVFEGQNTLVDWGGKPASGDKNKASMIKAGKLISLFQPKLIILEDTSAKGSRRSPRIQELTRKIVALASRQQVRVKLLSQKNIRKVLFPNGQGTKHDIARVVAERFWTEIGSRLPPKRRTWDSEARRMDYFEAIALVIVYRLKQTNRTAYQTTDSGKLP